MEGEQKRARAGRDERSSQGAAEGSATWHGHHEVSVRRPAACWRAGAIDRRPAAPGERRGLHLGRTPSSDPGRRVRRRDAVRASRLPWVPCDPEEVDDAVTIEIDDDRTVAAALPDRPVVDADPDGSRRIGHRMTVIAAMDRWLRPVAPGRRGNRRVVRRNAQRGTRGWRRECSCLPRWGGGPALQRPEAFHRHPRKVNKNYRNGAIPLPDCPGR